MTTKELTDKRATYQDLADHARYVTNDLIGEQMALDKINEINQKLRSIYRPGETGEK